MRNIFWIALIIFILFPITEPLSFGQGLQSGPYGAAPFLRRESPNFAPSNSVAGIAPADPQGLFPAIPNAGSPLNARSKDIPNFQMGYEFYSGKNWRVGYLTFDYLLPIRMAENSIVFGAAHSELQTSSTNLPRRSNEQAFLSFGGGYRKVLGGKTLVGFNGFYDTARFANRWVSSGGAGIEAAQLIGVNDALDVKFNWYGDLSAGDLVNQYHDGLANFDLQFGYSHQLFDGGPDLRVYSTVYDFDDKTGALGWQVGGELKSANGVVFIKGETAYDPVNGAYQNVSAFINIGFDLANLAKGKNPFVMPEPIFSSPRNMNRLTYKVVRNYRHTAHGLSLSAAGTQIVRVQNNRSENVRLYLGFKDNGNWKKTYNASDFPGFEKGCDLPWPGCNGGCNVLYKDLGPKEFADINFDTANKGPVSVSISGNMCTWGDCPQTMAEFTFIGADNKDTLDISLVNGFNYPMRISQFAQTDRNFTNGTLVAKVDHDKNNQKELNVYPLSCDVCDKIVAPPTPPYFPNCPAKSAWDQTQCKQPGDPPCHTGYAMGSNYKVDIQ